MVHILNVEDNFPNISNKNNTYFHNADNFLPWIWMVFMQPITYSEAFNSRGALDYKPTDVVIRPYVQNRRGYIGGGNVCLQNGYAIGFRMKMHGYVRNNFADIQTGQKQVGNNNAIFLSSTGAGELDNTALNGVRLICSGSGKEVHSDEGGDGVWTDFLKCQGNGDYMTGVRIKSESWQGWGICKISINTISLTGLMFSYLWFEIYGNILFKI